MVSAIIFSLDACIMSSTAHFSNTSTLVSSSAILFSPFTRGSALAITAASVFVLTEVSLVPACEVFDFVTIVFLVAAPVVFDAVVFVVVVTLLFVAFALSETLDVVLDVECVAEVVLLAAVFVVDDAVLDGRVDKI